MRSFKFKQGFSVYLLYMVPDKACKSGFKNIIMSAKARVFLIIVKKYIYFLVSLLLLFLVLDIFVLQELTFVNKK